MPSSKSPGASPAPDRSPDRLPGQPPVLAVVGPTASGKSGWALQLAEQLDGEIVSADSRQLYRRLNIGAAKPTDADRERVPHHCLDLRDLTEPISLAEYLDHARAAIADIQARDRLPVVVGGSGQYVWALLEGWQVPPALPDHAFRERMTLEAEARGADALHQELRRIDPQAAAKIDHHNVRRIIRALEVYEATGRRISDWQRERHPIRFAAIAPAHERQALDRRINDRTVAMFGAGLRDEVLSLLADGVGHDARGFDAIGYREVLAQIRGELSLLDAIVAVASATKRFSRRQYAWFRRTDPRIRWSSEPPTAHQVKAQIQALG